MIYPKSLVSSQEQFYWKPLRGTDGYGGELYFKINKYVYIVSQTEPYEDGVQGVVRGGVSITKLDKRREEKNFWCATPIEGNFYTLSYDILKSEEELKYN
jgi:hypothetical protein